MLYASVEAITGFLSDGDIVRLGDLGTFRLSLSSTGQAAPEDVDANSINGTRILFTPGTMLKNMLKNLQFEKEKQATVKQPPAANNIKCVKLPNKMAAVPLKISTAEKGNFHSRKEEFARQQIIII